MLNQQIRETVAQFKANLPPEMSALIEQGAGEISALDGDDSFTFPDPATYVIAPDGGIIWAFVPNNYRKRAEVDRCSCR